MNLDQLAAHIEAEVQKQVGKSVNHLKTAIIYRWPVDTGASQKGWKFHTVAPDHWKIDNFVIAPLPELDEDAEYEMMEQYLSYEEHGELPPELPSKPSMKSREYVPVLWKGYQGNKVGSKQLPGGGDPIVTNWRDKTLPFYISQIKL